MIQYPSLHVAADGASLRSQTAHFRVIRLQLVLFFGVALMAGLASVVPASYHQALAVGAVVSLAVAIAVAWIGRVGQFERVWFVCRAIAESVKSVSWLYMMRIPPFEEEASAEALLVDRFHEIVASWPGYEAHFATETAVAFSATPEMREIRAMERATRRNRYAALRLADEQAWYAGKCRFNRTRANQFFWATSILPIAALVAAIGQIGYQLAPVNVISPLMTLAASLVAWGQSKRYEDLAQAYSMAVMELGHLGGVLAHSDTDEIVASVVIDIEEAISREHKMWCVKRNVKTPG